MKFLLDTNVLSELRKRGTADPHVMAWVGRTNAADVGTSVLVLGEIRRGIELKRRKDPSQARVLDSWFALMRVQLGDRVLPVDEEIAAVWARLGGPNRLAVIDGLLAATALVNGLTLVTRNLADIARTGVATLDPFTP